ncbi:NrtA/SsuA/CpmA family ABC transporter substrate-binding protein [Geomonas sp. Red69]|uniref:NrtA/SsuA/CpmA family ABC transporter substrate-binding protein n=1 Tax=Geomonas diazotrophica TaxID=2843197 RepID=UPI001C11E948|nr:MULTISPECIES: NrtA/SsuA/CpmA family ABC transporter substrate-binding protein [Geomonas]MBU5636380.1 NrtA/SsuA/CpmA family ABC transporter substrate-binding protein [Geomonas diazotrophica]QXE88296.1 NrtA/SsuA/CpmA family ABC transporter substrate-binding protein [Geomonas nitrogeniifigens]
MRTLMRCLAIALLFSLCLCGCSRKENDGGAAKEGAAAGRYAGYRFGGDEVIDLGSQPLTLPEGAVAELIARDSVLASRLASQGFSVRVHPFFKGKDITEFLSSGKLQGGIFADMPALTAAASGDFVCVGLLKQGFATIVSGKPMLVRDLKGRRVATGLGSAAHFTLLSALQNEGLTEGDIKLVPMEISEMPKALAEGKIDAFSAWEPTPTLAFAAHPEFHMVHKGVSYGFLCLRRDFVRSHPDQARELAAAVVRACAWMRPPHGLKQAAEWTAASAARLQGAPYQVTGQAMGNIIRNDLLNVPGAPRIPATVLSEEGLLYRKFTFLKRTGNIPESTPWAKVRGSFDTEMMRQVVARGDQLALQRFDYRNTDQSDGVK